MRRSILIGTRLTARRDSNICPLPLRRHAVFVALRPTRGLIENETSSEDSRRGGASSRLLAILGGILLAHSATHSSPSAKEIEKGQEEEERKRRTGFRDRRVMSYEDRLRAFSTPDKLFRYFATVRRGDAILMTPDDFVRSITPGVKQPEGLGLDSFQRYSNDVDRQNRLCLPPNSVFYRLGKNALISFPDYLFLLTLLSSPPRQFEVAFRMFDRNGDGVLDKKEFEVVRSIITNSTAVGKRHRDREVTGNTLRAGGGGGGALGLVLSSYFFGKDGERQLSVDDFLEFQAQVQEEVALIEFQRYNPRGGKIHELDFAHALLMYAGFSHNKRKRMIRRVKQRFPRPSDDETNEDSGISFPEFYAFFNFLRDITAVETALSFFNFAGLPLDRSTFQHVAKTVTKTELSSRVLDVAFILFDENNDDRLSHREFISVMKRRQVRCLDKPMDTGFVRYLSSHFTCMWEQLRFRRIDDDFVD